VLPRYNLHKMRIGCFANYVTLSYVWICMDESSLVSSHHYFIIDTTTFTLNLILS